MKKTVFQIVLLLGVAVLFSSCLSMVFDMVSDSIPKTFKMTAELFNPANQNATVTFIDNPNTGYFKLKKWNDQDISLRLYGLNFNARYNSTFNKRNDKAILVVPAGDNGFLFDIVFKLGNTSASGTDIELRYFLEAGKEYHVKGRIERMSTLFSPLSADDTIRSYDVFVGIYDVTGGSETLLQEWDLRRGGARN